MIKKSLIFLFLIILIISSFGQSVQLTSKHKDKLYPDKKIVSRYHNDWTQGHYPKRIMEFKNDPLEFGDIVFIGNSITEKGGNWSERFETMHVRNRGISGDVTDGVLKRLDEIVYFKPKAVFILIGINDLFSLHNEEDGRNLKYDKVVPSTKYIGKRILKITKVIHRKSPETRVFVQTVLPTRTDYLKEDILLVNDMIKKNEIKGYYKVIDIYDRFVDADGLLTKELTVDGIHLSDKGYEKWVSVETPVVEDL